VSKIVDAVKEIELELSREKGPFTLFAVFEHPDIPNRWDLVVAAPWVEQDNEQALRRIAAELKKHLSANEMQRVSRIVLLDASDASVRALTSEHNVEHGRLKIDEGSHYGLPVEHGYVITARAAA
jgi:predicted sugar kinase